MIKAYACIKIFLNDQMKKMKMDAIKIMIDLMLARLIKQ